MKPLPNEIVLRPRFNLEREEDKEVLLKYFEDSTESPYVVKRIDDHVFIKFNSKETHFWSPQLHLEIIENESGGSKVHGLFGPNPTLWTFFMFLHFGVATFFIIFGIWAYSSAALNKPYGWLLGAMGAMIVLWFLFYFMGRAGKKKGRPQMQQLHLFLMKVISRKEASQD
ncbi:GTP-binding protein [Muriicola sp. SD30]|uniref:GTP-binding protein n=1 Tax=Muriicola sp. SD30 TaxID=3240936 RepID=UPI003510B764